MSNPTPTTPTPAKEREQCPACGRSSCTHDFDESCGYFWTCRDCEHKWSYADENRQPGPATRCPVGFAHPPHDFCDGNPGAKFFTTPTAADETPVDLSNSPLISHWNDPEWREWARINSEVEYERAKAMVELRTEQEMHLAWRKRAEEAEALLQTRVDKEQQQVLASDTPLDLEKASLTAVSLRVLFPWVADKWDLFDSLIAEVKRLEISRDDFRRDYEHAYDLLNACKASLAKAEAFKTFVHQTLDAMGVPADPDPEHNQKCGCRIGGRLKWLANVQVLLAKVEGERNRLAKIVKEVADWQGSPSWVAVLRRTAQEALAAQEAPR